jgi:LPXTG-motif cell wall-anchored protein
LPFTGSSSTLPGVGLAVVLLVVGSAFIVAVRRRSTARSRVQV